MASKTSTLKVNILGDASSLKRALGSAEKSSKTFGQKMRSGLATIAVGGAAVAGVGMFAKSFVDAGYESQKVTAQTEAVIKSMGGAANVTAGQVANLASSISNKTGIDDEAIQTGMNLLLTFGNVRNELGKGNAVYDRATKAAVDMSVAMGTDAKAASLQLGKALNDPTRGVNALARSGVSFTAQQKEQIKAMQESGDMLGAQKIILSEVERQFKGSAEAQATAGDRLRTTFGNLQEEIGAKLIPVVERVAGWLADNLPDAMETASAKARELGDKLAPLVSWLRDKIPPAVALIVTKLRSFGEWIATNKPALGAVAAVIGTALVGAFIAWASAAASAAVATLAATWPILAIGAAIAAVAAGAIYAYEHWGWFRDAVDKVAKFIRENAVPAFQVMWGVLQTVFAWIVDHWKLVAVVLGGPVVAAVLLIQTHWSKVQPLVAAFLEWLKVAWAVIQTVLVDPVVAAVKTVIENWDSIKSGFETVVDTVTSVVDSVVSIITGIGDRIGDVASALSSPFMTAFDAIKSAWNSTVGGFGFDVPDWIPGVGGKGFNIPTMHTGGVVPGGSANEVLRLLQGGEVVLDRNTVKSLGNTRAQPLAAPASVRSGGDTYIVHITQTDPSPAVIIKGIREARRQGLVA